MTAKIMKEVETLRLKLFTALANKLDWRVAMAVVFGMMVYFDGKIDRVMDEVDEVREIAVRNSEKIEQTRQIAMEGREIAKENSRKLEENSRKLDLLLMQNQIPQGATNTETNTPASKLGDDSASKVGYEISVDLDLDSEACYITPLILTPYAYTPSPASKLGEALVVAPGDTLGDTLGEGENLIIIASQ